MRGEPFTTCKMRVAWGDVPPVDAFLVTGAGSAYRVADVRGRTLLCVRWPREEVPADAEIIEWAWASRRRRS